MGENDENLVNFSPQNQNRNKYTFREAGPNEVLKKKKKKGPGVRPLGEEVSFKRLQNTGGHGQFIKRQISNSGAQRVSPGFFFGRNLQARVGPLDQNYQHLNRLEFVKDLSRYHHQDNLRLNLAQDPLNPDPQERKRGHLERGNLLSKMKP